MDGNIEVGNISVSPKFDNRSIRLVRRLSQDDLLTRQNETKQSDDDDELDRNLDIGKITESLDNVNQFARHRLGEKVLILEINSCKVLQLRLLLLLLLTTNYYHSYYY